MINLAWWWSTLVFLLRGEANLEFAAEGILSSSQLCLRSSDPAPDLTTFTSPILFLSGASPKSILMPEPLPQNFFVLWNSYLLGSLIKCTQSKLLFCILKRAFNWIWQQVRIVGFALAFEILEKLYLPSLLLSPISIFSFCHLFFHICHLFCYHQSWYFFILIRIRVMFSKRVCYDWLIDWLIYYPS